MHQERLRSPSGDCSSPDHVLKGKDEGEGWRGRICEVTTPERRLIPSHGGSEGRMPSASWPPLLAPGALVGPSLQKTSDSTWAQMTFLPSPFGSLHPTRSLFGTGMQAVGWNKYLQLLKLVLHPFLSPFKHAVSHLPVHPSSDDIFHPLTCFLARDLGCLWQK